MICTVLAPNLTEANSLAAGAQKALAACPGQGNRMLLQPACPFGVALVPFQL